MVRQWILIHDHGFNSHQSSCVFAMQIYRKDVIKVDYMIVSPHKSLYIRIVDGKPVTCTKTNMQRFEYSKACNILAHLPKTMHKFHFKVEPIREPITKDKPPDNNVQPVKRCIKKEYTTPIEVQGWLNRVKECNGLAKDAASRKAELIQQLSNVDKELSNCLHEIELSGNMNACNGYKEYRRTKIILEKRRVIKDELSVVESILTSNLQSMATNRIQKVVDGLGKRKFVIRDVDLDEIYIEG